MDYAQMVKFVKGFFESHDPIATGLESVYRYPFRRRFEHCFRCSIWAKRIALAEGADVELTEISALFHDIGKSVSKPGQNHGQVGAKICDEYLASIGYDDERRARVVSIVRYHSRLAQKKTASLEGKIVSDADLLDEVGAITVLWDTMACATRDDSPSYEKAYDRIAGGLTRLKTELPGRLHTPMAREIVAGRMKFVETFLKNLDYELGRSEI